MLNRYLHDVGDVAVAARRYLGVLFKGLKDVPAPLFVLGIPCHPGENEERL